MSVILFILSIGVMAFMLACGFFATIKSHSGGDLLDYITFSLMCISACYIEIVVYQGLFNL